MVMKVVTSNLAIISALTYKGVIGRSNHLPWKIPAELQYFKQITMGNVMIMGRNTFASLNMRALPGRYTIVVSKELAQVPSNVELARNIDEALELARQHRTSEIMIVGGSSIYQQFLPLVNRLYLSFIEQAYQGEHYFPVVDWEQWSEVKATQYPEFTAKVFVRKSCVAK